MSKSKEIIVTKSIKDGKETWITKPRLVQNWGGRFSTNDEREFVGIQGEHTDKNESVMNLYYKLLKMLKDAKAGKIDLDWKIRMLEELTQEVNDKHNDLIVFRTKMNKSRSKK